MISQEYKRCLRVNDACTAFLQEWESSGKDKKAAVYTAMRQLNQSVKEHTEHLYTYIIGPIGKEYAYAESHISKVADPNNPQKNVKSLLSYKAQLEQLLDRYSILTEDSIKRNKSILSDKQLVEQWLGGINWHIEQATELANQQKAILIADFEALKNDLNDLLIEYNII